MAPKTGTPAAEAKSKAKARERNEGPWLAFFDLVGPMGQTYHATIKAGATKGDIDEMYDLLAYAGKQSAQEGFGLISEYNEFGQRVALSRLAELRIAKHDAKVRQEQVLEQKQKRQATRTAAATTATPAPTTQPTTTRTASGKHWDLKKSPVEVNRIVVQGTKDEPKLEVYCSNKALQHPAFYIPLVVAVGVICRHYEIDREQLEGWLGDIGAEINLKKPWLVHWEPSTKNPKWKDVVDIMIPEKAAVRRSREEIERGEREAHTAAADGSPPLVGESEIPF